MSEDGAARLRRLIHAALLSGVMCALSLSAQGQQSASSSGPGTKAGTVVETHSDKRVVQTGRWYVTRQFTVNFAVKCSEHTYCGEVTTTVVNEVDDLMASKGQSVELLESGKDIDVTLNNGRHIRAHQVAVNKCAQN